MICCLNQKKFAVRVHKSSLAEMRDSAGLAGPAEDEYSDSLARPSEDER